MANIADVFKDVADLAGASARAFGSDDSAANESRELDIRRKKDEEKEVLVKGAIAPTMAWLRDFASQLQSGTFTDESAKMLQKDLGVDVSKPLPVSELGHIWRGVVAHKFNPYVDSDNESTKELAGIINTSPRASSVYDSERATAEKLFVPDLTSTADGTITYKITTPSGVTQRSMKIVQEVDPLSGKLINVIDGLDPFVQGAGAPLDPATISATAFGLEAIRTGNNTTITRGQFLQQTKGKDVQEYNSLLEASNNMSELVVAAADSPDTKDATGLPTFASLNRKVGNIKDPTLKDAARLEAANAATHILTKGYAASQGVRQDTLFGFQNIVNAVAGEDFEQFSGALKDFAGKGELQFNASKDIQDKLSRIADARRMLSSVQTSMMQSDTTELKGFLGVAARNSNLWPKVEDRNLVSDYLFKEHLTVRDQLFDNYSKQLDAIEKGDLKTLQALRGQSEATILQHAVQAASLREELKFLHSPKGQELLSHGVEGKYQVNAFRASLYGLVNDALRPERKYPFVGTLKTLRTAIGQFVAKKTVSGTDPAAKGAVAEAASFASIAVKDTAIVINDGLQQIMAAKASLALDPDPATKTMAENTLRQGALKLSLATFQLAGMAGMFPGSERKGEDTVVDLPSAVSKQYIDLLETAQNGINKAFNNDEAAKTITDLGIRIGPHYFTVADSNSVMTQDQIASQQKGILASIEGASNIPDDLRKYLAASVEASFDVAVDPDERLKNLVERLENVLGVAASIQSKDPIGN